MSFEALHERLTALQETTAQLQELVDRLAKLKFEPGSVPLGSDDENNVAAELSAEINQILREEEEDLELLQEEVTDLRSGRPGSEAEHNKARLKDGLARLDGELKSCRVAFRRAQLSARQSLEQAQRLERRLLLASYAASATSTPPNDRSGASSPGPSGQQQQPAASSHPTTAPHQQLFPAGYRRRQQQQQNQKHHNHDAAVTAAGSDVTAALRRTHDQIASELSRSAFARQTLAESTAALGTLQGNYAGLEGLLASSRELAGTLLTSGKSDTWYLETAFMLLAGTLGWLVFRRWLYGPLWWVVWLPVRTAWWTGSAMVRRGEGAGKGEAMMPPVGEEGGQRPVMGEKGAVPTVRVAGDETEGAGGDPDSMVEKVGRIIKGEAQGGEEGDTAADNSSGNEPNPKKRMWEEENVPSAGGGRAKDEL